MADSTSAAREAAIEASAHYLGDSDRCCLRPEDDFGGACVAVQKAFIDGAEWARSQPRVVSEAAVEAAVVAIESNYGGNAYDDMRVALAAAYAVEEQQNG